MAVTGTSTVSVILPTYDRREQLARKLAALSRQSVDLRTVAAVVVDDGSTDGTSEWLDDQCRVATENRQRVRWGRSEPARFSDSPAS